MSPDLPSSRLTGASLFICLRKKAYEGKSDVASYLVPKIQAFGGIPDLGWLQLIRSRFSNIMCSKNEVSWQPEYTEWTGFSNKGFFSTLSPWLYSKKSLNASGSIVKEYFREHVTSLSHTDWLPVSGGSKVTSQSRHPIFTVTSEDIIKQ